MTSEVGLLLLEDGGLEIERRRRLDGLHRHHASSESRAGGDISGSSGGERPHGLSGERGEA